MTSDAARLSGATPRQHSFRARGKGSGNVRAAHSRPIADRLEVLLPLLRQAAGGD
jgi:hypothetical protein